MSSVSVADIPQIPIISITLVFVIGLIILCSLLNVNVIVLGAMGLILLHALDLCNLPPRAHKQQTQIIACNDNGGNNDTTLSVSGAPGVFVLRQLIDSGFPRTHDDEKRGEKEHGSTKAIKSTLTGTMTLPDGDNVSDPGVVPMVYACDRLFIVDPHAGSPPGTRTRMVELCGPTAPYRDFLYSSKR